jgi:hypothetical protein
MAPHERYERLIDALVTEPGSAGRGPDLAEHARGCARCRERYNRVVFAERLLYGGPAALNRPSPAELDRVLRSVLRDAQERTPSAWAALRAWLLSPRGLVPVAVALVAIVAVPLLLSRPDTSSGPTGETLQARGGISAEPHIGFRAFCLTPSTVVALDATPSAALPRCSRTAQLKLAITNHGGFRKVFLVGVDASHRVKWYAPRPPQAESIDTPRGDAVDEPVGTATRLEINHTPGPLRIYALFSKAPIRAAEVEEAIATLSRSGTPPAAAAQLPLGRTDVTQRSLLLELTP